MNGKQIIIAAQNYFHRLTGIGVDTLRASDLHNEMIDIIDNEKLSQKETALLTDFLVGIESFSLKQDKAPHIKVDLEELRKQWDEAPDIKYETVENSTEKGHRYIEPEYVKEHQKK